jgi:hypothetical protein
MQSRLLCDDKSVADAADDSLNLQKQRTSSMKSIQEWLDDKYEEMATSSGFSNETVYFERQADILRTQAQEDGYGTLELADQCQGNVAAYLMNRVNTLNKAEIVRAVENAPYGE